MESPPPHLILELQTKVHSSHQPHTMGSGYVALFAPEKQIRYAMAHHEQNDKLQKYLPWAAKNTRLKGAAILQGR